MKARANISLQALAVLMGIALVVYALIGAVISTLFHVSFGQALIDIGLVVFVIFIINLAMITLEPRK